jgi:hypothetical protein
MFDLNYIKNMLDDIYVITTPYIVEYTNKILIRKQGNCKPLENYNSLYSHNYTNKNYIVSICNYFNIKIYSCCKTSKEFYNTALIPV